MLSQTIGNVQLLAFTHTLIDLNIHHDEPLYEALVTAYDALLDNRVADGYAALAGRVAMPGRMPIDLRADIQALVEEHSA